MPRLSPSVTTVLLSFAFCALSGLAEAQTATLTIINNGANSGAVGVRPFGNVMIPVLISLILEMIWPMAWIAIVPALVAIEGAATVRRAALYGWLVGLVANIRGSKGHAHFLEAACLVLPEIPAVRFLIVGDGVGAETVRAQVGALGLEGQVIMTGFRRDVPEVMAALDALFDSSPLGIALFDEQKRFVRVNKALLKLNNKSSSEDLIGRTVEEVLPSFMADEISHTQSVVLETGRSRGFA